MAGQKLDLTINQGKTFSMVLRWATEPYIYKSITGIAQSAPVRLTVPTHGMPDGWRFGVSAVQGMTQLNAKKSPPDAKEFYEATVIDANTIDINTVNGLLLSAYKSGGVVQYLTPVDMTGMSARMSIKDKVGGTELLSLHTDTGEITLDAAAHTITLRLEPAVTEALTWTKGEYDLEIYNVSDVFLLCYGKVDVAREVTTVT